MTFLYLKIRSLLALPIIVLTSLMLTQPAFASEELSENVSYTALVAAYQGEFDNILEMLEGEEIERVEYHNGVAFHIGKINDYPIIIFQTGIGLTNAAITTQLAFSQYPIKQLLFSGVAGGLDPRLEKGDISLPSSWVIYGFGAQFTKDPEAERGAKIPEFMLSWINENQYQNYFPFNMMVLKEGAKTPVPMESFPSDPELDAIFREVAANANLVDAKGDDATILLDSVGGSGLTFNDDADYSQFLRKTWNIGSVDMESAVIAQTCFANSVPCMQIRGISDVVGNENSNEFSEFKHVAEKNAARFLNMVMQSGKLPK